MEDRLPGLMRRNVLVKPEPTEQEKLAVQPSKEAISTSNPSVSNAPLQTSQKAASHVAVPKVVEIDGKRNFLYLL